MIKAKRQKLSGFACNENDRRADECVRVMNGTRKSRGSGKTRGLELSASEGLQGKSDMILLYVE